MLYGIGDDAFVLFDSYRIFPGKVRLMQFRANVGFAANELLR